MARKKRGMVGPIEAQQISAAITAAKSAMPLRVQSDDPRPYSDAGIRSVAAGIPDADRTPDAVMLDTILRAYWRMEKPSKKELLRQYRARCTSGIPDFWIKANCEMAAFLESLLRAGI